MSIFSELDYNSNIRDIRGIQFSLLSPDEIKKRSVVHVTQPILYDTNGSRALFQHKDTGGAGNGWLLGFDNGIVDLKYETINENGSIISETIFREGRPDDSLPKISVSPKS